MSLVSAMSISLSGLNAATTQLEVTADNLANASVEGYTKKSADLTTATLGQAGSGVRVTGFSRSEDNALFSTLMSSTTNAGYLEVQDDYMQRVLDLLGTSASDEPAITTAMTDFTTAWSSLAAAPESTVAQQQVIQAADNLADTIQNLAADVEELDRTCVNDINSSLSDLNSYLERVHDLNERISLLTASGMSSGNLEDERDQVILKISEMVGITLMNRGNNQVAIYTSGGYQLLDGSSVASLSYNGTNLYEDSNPSLVLDDTLTGGSLEALTNFRKETSPVSADSATSVTQKLRDQLDLIAENFLNLVTTATSGEATFASAYNNAAENGTAVSSQYLLSDAMRLTARTPGEDGNNISYIIEDGTTLGTYQITITYGATSENYNDIDIGSSPYDWTAMIDAINTSSALVVATAHNMADLDPTLLTLSTTYTLYGGSEASSPGELDSDFFTGTDRTNIAVNAALLNGTATIKISCTGDVVSSLTDSTRVFSADGLSTTGSSYTSVVTSLLSSFQQSASNVSSLSQTASEQQSYLQEKLANGTGVNTDEEMAKLIILQQAYTACAKVMTVADEMFTILVNVT